MIFLSERLREEKEREKTKGSKTVGGGLGGGVGGGGMKKSQSTNFDFPSSPAKKWPANGPGIYNVFHRFRQA